MAMAYSGRGSYRSNPSTRQLLRMLLGNDALLYDDGTGMAYANGEGVDPGIPIDPLGPEGPVAPGPYDPGGPIGPVKPRGPGGGGAPVPPTDPIAPPEPKPDPVKPEHDPKKKDTKGDGAGGAVDPSIWQKLVGLLGGAGKIFDGLGGGGGGGGQSQVQIPEVPAYQQSQPQSDMGPLLMALFSQGQGQQSTANNYQGQQPDIAALIAALTGWLGGYQGGGY